MSNGVIYPGSTTSKYIKKKVAQKARVSNMRTRGVYERDEEISAEWENKNDIEKTIQIGATIVKTVANILG